MPIVFLLLLWCLFPAWASAAVLIHEIAWMGSLSSANHEWIELHNTGEAVDVEGWILTDGMNLTIPLTGNIPSGGYAVLERTSDASAPGTAFLIYTGAIVNSGATLTLRRANGEVEDQVSGGENWQSIGGDNTTKETAQYTTAGWVTGAPTPGTQNSGSVRTPAPPATSTTSSGTVTSSPSKSAPIRKASSGETVRLEYRGVTLGLTIGGQKVAYVNQPVEFSVEPHGVGRSFENSLTYFWNFGDGNVGLGKKVTHTFSYPGTYIVTTFGSYAKQKQVSRHEITVLPVALSITRTSSGDIQINNDAPYDLDISAYTVRGTSRFVFPPYSIIMQGQTITLPVRRVGAGPVDVLDAKKAVVASESLAGNTDYPTEAFSNNSYLNQGTHTMPQAIISQSQDTTGRFGFAQRALAATEEEFDTATATPGDVVIPEEDPSITPETPTWPYVALLGVILLGLIAGAPTFGRNQNE